MAQAQDLRRKKLENIDLVEDVAEQQRGSSPHLYDRLQTLKTYKDETGRLESMPLRDKHPLQFTGKYGIDEAIQNQENHDTINTTAYINQIVDRMRSNPMQENAK